jgi:hypothetical protein
METLKRLFPENARCPYVRKKVLSERDGNVPGAPWSLSPWDDESERRSSLKEMETYGVIT